MATKVIISTKPTVKKDGSLKKKPGPRGAIATSFKKGQSGNPKGRKPGQKAKYDQLSNEQRQAIAAITGGLSPLDLFISIVRSESDIPLELRMQAARDAAPYLHRKMPIAIDGGENKPISMLDIAQLKGLSTAELTTLLKLVEKAGANVIGDE